MMNYENQEFMTNDRLATKIEAILYLKGQPLSLTEIAEYALLRSRSRSRSYN